MDESFRENNPAPEAIPSPVSNDRIAQLVCQFHSSQGRKDGSGRITFEFGAESMLEFNKILMEHSLKPTNFHVTVIPEDLIRLDTD